MQNLMTTVLQNDDDVDEDAFNLHEKKLMFETLFTVSVNKLSHILKRFLLRKLELFYFSVIASYMCICIYTHLYIEIHR